LHATGSGRSVLPVVDPEKKSMTPGGQQQFKVLVYLV